MLEVRQYTSNRGMSQLQVYYDRLDKVKTLPTYYGAFSALVERQPPAVTVDGQTDSSKYEESGIHDMLRGIRRISLICGIDRPCKVPGVRDVTPRLPHRAHCCAADDV